MTALAVLRAALAASPLTEEQVATKSRTAIGLLRRYVRGQVDVGPKVARRLGRVLNVDPAELIFGRPKQPKPTVEVAPPVEAPPSDGVESPY